MSILKGALTCIILTGSSSAIRAETSLQSAFIAHSAAFDSASSCRSERVRISACGSADILVKAAKAHYRAMMPADMEGAYYRWELASKSCENGCDDKGLAFNTEAMFKYETIELKYLSEGANCKSKMDSSLCFSIDYLKSKHSDTYNKGNKGTKGS